MSNLIPSEKLAQFVEAKINPIELTNEEICKATHILDWLMQKSWAKSLEYKSWPDGETHKVYDGLWYVFNLIDKLSSSVDDMQKAYNNELYNQYVLLSGSLNKEALDALDKLNKIKEIL